LVLGQGQGDRCGSDEECEDYDMCTKDECIFSRVCLHSVFDCNDDDPCTIDSCDRATGCINFQRDCDDLSNCTDDYCDENGICQHLDNCFDWDSPWCIVGNCNGDKCVYQVADLTIGLCDDTDPCTLDSCSVDYPDCIHEPLDCDDGNPCTIDCDNHGCVQIENDCDDDNPCTADSCDPSIGCVHTLIPCDFTDVYCAIALSFEPTPWPLSDIKSYCSQSDIPTLSCKVNFYDKFTYEYDASCGLAADIDDYLWVLRPITHSVYSGTIPTVIGLLPQLRVLVLGSEGIYGTIPTQIGKLRKLASFGFVYSQLVGTIPTQIGLLTLLTELSFEINQLTGEIPTQIGLLTRLTYLHINDNQLTGTIPTQIGLLTQLRWLFIQNNQLTGEIPTQIGLLTQLTWLLCL